MKRLLFAAIIVAAAACGTAETAGPGPTSSTPTTSTTTTLPGGAERTLLEQARATWTANRPDTYRYTYALSCECDGGPWVIHIDGTTLVDVSWPGPSGPGDYLPYTTIESIFDDIAATLDEGRVPVEVVYDPALGYPLSYTWNGPELPVDGGFVLTVSEFEADPKPVDPALLAELREAQQRWESLGWFDYDYVFTRGCFCPPEWVGPYAVEVRTGAIVGASYNGTDLFDVGSLEIGRYDEIVKTVPGLFDEIERALQEADHIDVSYHAEYGYPTDVYIDWDRNTADEEVNYTIAGLREPLPTLDSCSTTGLDLQLADQPGLPAAVAATRRAIFDAAMACDVAGLALLASTEGFTASFGGGEPGMLWAQQESSGYPALRTLVQHLNLAVTEWGDGGDIAGYVWPSAFLELESAAGDGLPVEEYESLLELYPLAELEEMFAAIGGYIGHRIGIEPDGTWIYYVAGD